MPVRARSPAASRRARPSWFPRRLRTLGARAAYRPSSATERHQRAQALRRGRTDAAHRTEGVQRAERAGRITMGHHPRGQRRPDPGKRLDLRLGGTIQVHQRRRTVLRPYRSGGARRGGTAATSRPPGRAGGVHPAKLGGERRGVGRKGCRVSRAPQPNRAAAECKEHQEAEGLPFVRGRHPARCQHPAAPRRAESRGPRRFVARRYFSSSVRATSPTICRLRALTRSGVSRRVWCRLESSTQPVPPSAQ